MRDDDPLHSFTKTGWCLCLRGTVARLLQLTCLASRGQGACRPGVPVLAKKTSRDPGRCGEEVVTSSARCCRCSYRQQWQCSRRDCTVCTARRYVAYAGIVYVCGIAASAERRVRRAAARERYARRWSSRSECASGVNHQQLPRTGAACRAARSRGAQGPLPCASGTVQHVE